MAPEQYPRPYILPTKQEAEGEGANPNIYRELLKPENPSAAARLHQQGHTPNPFWFQRGTEHSNMCTLRGGILFKLPMQKQSTAPTACGDPKGADLTFSTFLYFPDRSRGGAGWGLSDRDPNMCWTVLQ